MSKSKEIEKLVTAKSNKAEIKDAYKEAIKAIKELESSRFNPQEESVKIKNDETVSKVEKELNQAVTNRQGIQYLNTAINSIAAIITQLKVDYEESKEGIEKSQAEYNEIKEAIKIQNNKLKELYDVEDVFIKLSNLITYYDDKEVKLRESYNTRLLDIEEELTTAKAKLKEDLEDLKLQYKKKFEEMDYDFNRKKLLKTNELQDFLDNKEKEFNLKIAEEQALADNKFKALKEEQENFKKDKKEIEAYEAEIQSLKESREADIELAKEQAKDKAKKSFDYEVRYIKKDFESKMEIANNNIETLNGICQQHEKTIADYKSKLEAAYNRIEDLAHKSMETSANKETIASLENMINKQNTKSDK